MGKRDFNPEFDDMIRAALRIEDQPPVQLNNELKAELYERERMMRQTNPGKVVSLWYLPMVLNLIIFTMIGVVAVLLTSNLYLAVLAAAVCTYMALAGVIITVVGVKRTNLKEDIMIRIEKGGAGI